MLKKYLILGFFIGIQCYEVSAQLIKVSEYGIKTDSVNNISSNSTMQRTQPLYKPDTAGITEDSASLFFYPLHNILLTSMFGVRYHPILHISKMHNGIDLRANNEPVYAFTDGTIEKAAWDSRAGYYIVIRHTENLETVYAHLNYLLVQVGQQVMAGAIIAISGNTGLSTAPHLHFGVKYKGIFIDPLYILSTPL